MDKKQLQKILLMREHFDRSYNIKHNVIKINKTNTLQHEISKFLVCWELIQNGEGFYTEVIFKNGKRCDIVSDDMTIYEIMHSETEKKLSQKDYPFKIIALKSENILRNYKEELEEKKC